MPIERRVDHIYIGLGVHSKSRDNYRLFALSRVPDLTRKLQALKLRIVIAKTGLAADFVRAIIKGREAAIRGRATHATLVVLPLCAGGEQASNNENPNHVLLMARLLAL
jgi:hypothetical protein